jgi:phenylphosphate carboxylase alpha subunit
MAYKYWKDNRQFIKALIKSGDAITVNEEVDWDLEMGAIVRLVCEKKAPAPYFKHIKDYPGFEAFGAPLATHRKLAVAFGMDPASSIPDLAKEYLKRTSTAPIKPVIVAQKDAPCQEIVLKGDKASLMDLPAPMVHEGDGGRYVATWHMVVAKDYDTDFVNWGMYRQMIFDERTMVGPVLPFSDMGKFFYGKYAPRNLPMPFATVIGPDPLSAIAACAPSPIAEEQFTGMLMGEPVELVKCRTSDLYVPAQAEIIIEGVVIPNVTMDEGPFGEYTGYRVTPRDKRAVYRVQAITMRKKPIMTVSVMGVPTDEGQLLRSFSLGLEMDKLLRDQGIPITGVYMLPESTHHLVVVGVKPVYANIASQVAQLVFGSKLGPWFHMVVVVDDKTDIYSKDALIHALSTKCDPGKGIRVYKDSVGTPFYPFLNEENRKHGRVDKVVFDCILPTDWAADQIPTKVSFDNVYPQDIQDKVLAKWKTYGFAE